MYLVGHGFDHILGEPFPVEVPSEAIISHLKEKVKASWDPELAHIAIDSLVVWKCPGLKLPADDESDDELMARINLFKMEARRHRGPTKLSSLAMPLDEMLLVQMPGTYSHSTLLYPNDLPVP